MFSCDATLFSDMLRDQFRNENTSFCNSGEANIKLETRDAEEENCRYEEAGELIGVLPVLCSFEQSFEQVLFFLQC